MARVRHNTQIVCDTCSARYDFGFSSPDAADPVQVYLCKVCPNEINESRSDLDERNAFLRLPFDNEHADGILRGEAIIVVQGKTDEPLYVHKFVLSSKSPVFSKMFNNKMLKGETRVVRIDDTTLPAMRSVIKFCYDAEIIFSDDVTGEDVLAVAHKYDIALLRKICEKHLIETINNGNLPKRLKVARKFEVTDLEAAATAYLKDNYDSVISAVLAELRT